jgi:hypothetical protein
LKTAVIISGMLRNYDAALLSLPIWGDITEVDRYLVTWKSAGDVAIADYCNKAQIKDKLIVDDGVVSTFPAHLRRHNWARMIWLWQSAFKWVPKRGYDKYILIRPDGFYWTFDVAKLQELVGYAERISPLGNVFAEGLIGDQLTIISPQYVNYIANAYNILSYNALKRISLAMDCEIHSMLGDFYGENLSDSFTYNSYQAGLEVLLVRDSYKLYNTDVYNYNLYRDIFFDTAAWWKRNTGVSWHFTPQTNVEK